MTTTLQSHNPSAPAKARTVATLLLDASGSMQAKTSQTLEGAADFLDTLRALPVTCEVSFCSFHHLFKSGEFALTGAATYLTRERYKAKGDTALYDAIFKVVDHVESHVRPGDRVIVGVLTDGADTCSAHRVEDAKRLIARKQAEGWTFIYVGPNTRTADALGIDPSMRAAITSGIREAIAQITKRTVQLLLPPPSGPIVV